MKIRTKREIEINCCDLWDAVGSCAERPNTIKSEIYRHFGAASHSYAKRTFTFHTSIITIEMDCQQNEPNESSYVCVTFIVDESSDFSTNDQILLLVWLWYKHNNRQNWIFPCENSKIDCKSLKINSQHVKVMLTIMTTFYTNLCTEKLGMNKSMMWPLIKVFTFKWNHTKRCEQQARYSTHRLNCTFHSTLSSYVNVMFDYEFHVFKRTKVHLEPQNNGQK